MHTSTLLLVGPNKLSHASFRNLFEGSPFAVVGETLDIATLESDAVPDPDIALIECPSDPEGILKTLEQLNTLYPDTPVVVLDSQVRMATLAACLAAGVRGFLTTDITPEALLKSLQLVVLGESVFPTYLAGMLVDDVRLQRPLTAPDNNEHGLSGREIETIQCLLSGESNKVIARRLSITEATIKVHIKSLLRKIKVINRTQAAIWAHRHGYLPTRTNMPIIDDKARLDLN
jgi:two-component system nitrate/nitrite response regulator NarL